MKPLLIYAGSAEGHALAQALNQGVPRARVVLPAPLRTDPGGVDYEITEHWSAELVEQGGGPVVLATHPGDPALRDTLPAACAAAGRPFLHLCRPAWAATQQDLWHDISDPSELDARIPKEARVFVGLGGEVRDYLAFLRNRYLVIRHLGQVRAPWTGHGHYLESTAPFTIAEEIATLREERIDWLLVRNAGGSGGWPKLAAARALGLPVAMLRRPCGMADVPVAETVEDALKWVRSRGEQEPTMSPGESSLQGLAK